MFLLDLLVHDCPLLLNARRNCAITRLEALNWQSEVLLLIVAVVFTQDIQVKVLSLLSRNVRNNAGVATPVSDGSVYQTQTMAA